MSYFKAEGLKKEWPGISIDFSFEAEQNDFVCITGPSGSGKSTVLRLIAGLIPLQKESGAKILLGQKDITNLPPAKRELGFVFQSPALFSHMTVEDNIGYGLTCNGTGKKERRAQASLMLKKFSLEGFAKREPQTLSGGEAQRVALARTLIVKPKLVLFDEPMSALDSPLRKKLGQDILFMQKEFGFTAIMVTHDIQEAKTLGTKIILMEKGKKVWEGKPSDYQNA